MLSVKVPSGKMIGNLVNDSFQVFGPDLKLKNGCQNKSFSEIPVSVTAWPASVDNQ